MPTGEIRAPCGYRPEVMIPERNRHLSHTSTFIVHLRQLSTITHHNSVQIWVSNSRSGVAEQTAQLLSGCFHPKIGGFSPKMDGLYIVENPMNKWMIWGLSHIFGNTQVFLTSVLLGHDVWKKWSKHRNRKLWFFKVTLRSSHHVVEYRSEATEHTNPEIVIYHGGICDHSRLHPPWN